MAHFCKVVLITGLAWTIGIAPVAAEASRNLALTYRVYYGGFEALELGIDIALTARRYDMRMNFRTFGFIGRLFPWTMQAYSRGKLADASVRPEAAGQNNVWRGKKRWVNVRYERGLAVVADSEPPPGGGDRATVPASQLRETVDLAAAILVVARLVQSERTCDGRVPVFDGRRRFDLVLQRTGEERLKRSAYSAFQGATVTCRAGLKRINGFKRGEGHGSWGEDGRAAALWMGRVFDDALPVPVRLEMETQWGVVIAHLARAEFDSDGVKRVITTTR